MEPIETRTYNLRGSHYAIGCQLGKQAASNEYLKAKYVVKAAVDPKQIRETNAQLERWLSGHTEEVQGFAEGLNVQLDTLVF